MKTEILQILPVYLLQQNSWISGPKKTKSILTPSEGATVYVNIPVSEWVMYHLFKLFPSAQRSSSQQLMIISR